MTDEEVRKVINILLEADGECYICSGKLVEDFIGEFPKYKALATNLYSEKYGRKLGDYS